MVMRLDKLLAHYGIGTRKEVKNYIRKGFVTMLLAHIMFCIPYVILSIMPKLRSLDPNLIDAALDLGATPIQALTKVVVPQITSGIVAGALIAFTMSFDDFVISYFVTGNGVNNISIMVYTMSKRVNPTINAISTLIIVIITVALLLLNIIPFIKERKRRKWKNRSRNRRADTKRKNRRKSRNKRTTTRRKTRGKQRTNWRIETIKQYIRKKREIDRGVSKHKNLVRDKIAKNNIQ